MNKKILVFILKCDASTKHSMSKINSTIMGLLYGTKTSTAMAPIVAASVGRRKRPDRRSDISSVEQTDLDCMTPFQRDKRYQALTNTVNSSLLSQIFKCLWGVYGGETTHKKVMRTTILSMERYLNLAIHQL